MASILAPVGSVLGSGAAQIAKYWWILVPIVVVISGFLIVSLIKKFKLKNSQWTHILKVRRVISPDGRLSDVIIHKMRRFNILHRADVFELEKPLLGSYLFPEVGSYSGLNEFSIIVDENNRVYTNRGEFFKKEACSVQVSARHAEIDLSRQRLKENFQKVNAVGKATDWVGIAKWGAMIIFLIVGMVLGLKGLDKWGEAHQADAQKAQAEAQTYENLNKVMITVDGTVKSQQLLLAKFEQAFGTKNLQSILNNGTSKT